MKREYLYFRPDENGDPEKKLDTYFFDIDKMVIPYPCILHNPPTLPAQEPLASGQGKRGHVFPAEI